MPDAGARTLPPPHACRRPAHARRRVRAALNGARDDVRRVCLWSGPRNVSTALMVSFAQRADTRVLDEPLYAHYLRVSGADHPGREEVLRALDPDGARVVRDVVLGPCDRPVLFQKHMAHHLVELDRAFLRRTVNVLLVRDPEEVVVTLEKQLARPALRDVGVRTQCELLDELRAAGQEPPVLDARETLLDPEGVLGELCRRLGIAFDRSMLAWPAGRKPYFGVWAPHWYQNVERSTGFERYRPKTEPVPERLRPLIDECRPWYAKLHAAALKAGPH